jgi:hypothetical protein
LLFSARDYYLYMDEKDHIRKINSTLNQVSKELGMRSSEELVINDPEAALRAMTEAAFGGDEQAAIAYATERARALVHHNEKPQEEPTKEKMSPPPPEHA